MALFSFRKSLIIASIALAVVMLGSSEANAQSRRDIERERQRIGRERQRQVRRDNSSISRRDERRISNAYYSGGYEQGYLAGVSDRRKGKYNRSNVYRDTGFHPTNGDPTSGDYLYRQGYLSGYEDGFYGRLNY